MSKIFRKIFPIFLSLAAIFFIPFKTFSFSGAEKLKMRQDVEDACNEYIDFYRSMRRFSFSSDPERKFVDSIYETYVSKYTKIRKKLTAVRKSFEILSELTPRIPDMNQEKRLNSVINYLVNVPLSYDETVRKCWDLCPSPLTGRSSFGALLKYRNDMSKELLAQFLYYARIGDHSRAPKKVSKKSPYDYYMVVSKIYWGYENYINGLR